MNDKRKSGLKPTQTAQTQVRCKEHQPTHNKYSLAEIIRSVTGLVATALGLTLLFIAAGLTDGNGTERQITIVAILALVNLCGGVIALKLEVRNESENK